MLLEIFLLILIIVLFFMLGRTKKKIDIYELEKKVRKTYSQIKLTFFFRMINNPRS